MNNLIVTPIRTEHLRSRMIANVEQAMGQLGTRTVIGWILMGMSVLSVGKL